MHLNPPKHIVAAGMLVERGDEVLSFDGRVLFQSYTTTPFTIHAQKFG